MSSQLLVTAAPAKHTPGDLPLTLTADVLRVPYAPATRLVLAEIISLYAATGNCYCSDAHLAARLTISLNTVSRAVQQLEAAGLITKHVDKAAGNHRLLVPVPAAIKVTAATNPYPQNEGRGTTPKTRVGYPQNEGSPTPKTEGTLPPKWGTNTTVNTTGNLQETLTPSEPEKKIELGEFSEAVTPSLKAENELLPPVAEPPQPARVTAAELPAALATEAKTLANEIGQLWHITEIRNQPKWARIHTFCRRLAVLGRLPEVQQQFAGYRLQRNKAGIRPHQLDTWLGKPADDFANGEWCGCDWAAVAADTRTRPGEALATTIPARADTSPTKARTRNWS